MPDDFVHNIRLRSVVWSFRMSQVLRARESFEGETIEKLPLTDDSVYGLYHETGLALQIQ